MMYSRLAEHSIFPAHNRWESRECRMSLYLRNKDRYTALLGIDSRRIAVLGDIEEDLVRRIVRLVGPSHCCIEILPRNRSTGLGSLRFHTALGYI